MRTPTALFFALAALATAAPQTPDKPIELVLSVYETSLTCDTSTGAKSVNGNGCQNRTLPKGGSAFVRASTASPNGYVTGYSEADCKGEVLVVFTKSDGCTGFDDVEVKSWISGAPFDESG